MSKIKKFNNGVIVHGDSMKLYKTIKPGTVDLMFCDPPYGLSTASKMKVTRLKTGWKGLEEKWDMFGYDKKGKFSKERWIKDYTKFTMKWLVRAKHLLKPDGTIFVSGTFHNIGILNVCLQRLGFYLLNDITWYKPNAAPNFTCKQLCASTETILWARRSEKVSNHKFNYQISRRRFPDIFHYTHIQVRTYNEKIGKTYPWHGKETAKIGYSLEQEKGLQMRDLWCIPIVGGHETTKFPSQKPIELLRRCLTIASDEGDLVVDLFGGSGSTAVTCQLMKRRFIVFEKGAEQFKLMYHRLIGSKVQWDRDKNKVIKKKKRRRKKAA